MEARENKVVGKKVEYIVDYYDPRKFKAYRESFGTLIDAKAFKKEIMDKYKSVEIIKRMVLEELII